MPVDDGPRSARRIEEKKTQRGILGGVKSLITSSSCLSYCTVEKTVTTKYYYTTKDIEERGGIRVVREGERFAKWGMKLTPLGGGFPSQARHYQQRQQLNSTNIRACS